INRISAQKKEVVSKEATSFFMKRGNASGWTPKLQVLQIQVVQPKMLPVASDGLKAVLTISLPRLRLWMNTPREKVYFNPVEKIYESRFFLIFSCIAASSSFEGEIFGCMKLISFIVFNGTRCTCVCGTSRPITATPIRIHGTLRLIAAATFFAKTIKPPSNSSSRSKM